MKDIERAILAEQEYIQDIDPDLFPLIERVKEFGFETLDEYFHDKIKYQIVNENLTVQPYHMEDGIAAVFDHFNRGQAGAFTVRETYDRTWVWAGKDNEYFNAEKAKELGLGITNFNYFGGPIITNNNDFSLALVLPKDIDFDRTLLIDYILDYLRSKGHEPAYDNNDILVNGKKVFGAASCKNDKSKLFAFTISLSEPDLELISQLSLKQSEKIPGHINNINRDEFEEVINQWLHSI